MALKKDGDLVRINMNLTKDQKAELDAIAQKHGVTTSSMIRIAIASWLDDQRKEG